MSTIEQPLAANADINRMRYWHVNFATVDRLPLFSGNEGMQSRQRDAALWRVARLTLPVLLFCLVDDHVHWLLAGTRKEVGQLVRRIKRCWLSLCSSPLSAAHYEAVERRSHMVSLIRYFLQQPQHHRLDVHPALWSGSCFPDLIGARLLPGLQPSIGRLLPRISLEDICRAASIEVPVAASASLVRQRGLQELAHAGSAALATDCRAATQVASIVRRACVRLADDAGFNRRDQALQWQSCERTLRRLASSPADPAIIEAIRLQLAIRAQLLSVPGPAHHVAAV